ncbi:MAG: hypothetical protein LJE94_09290 [Deltaproteobacteria bacterium]|nr:hypothetical protein [Deltaproteobacteria bacterium]
MKLLNENFNYDVDCKSFIDELDSFDEFDIEYISRDFDGNKFIYKIAKDIDRTFESIS